MSDVVFRKGEHVLLRPLQRADIPALRRWMNDPETTQYRLARAFPLMEKAEEEWLDRLSVQRRSLASAS
jgi:RimJ/RimL family protein N-acetyltransferase